MRSGRTLTTILGLIFASLLSACATYQTELNQGIKYYESNEHEKSLAIFRVLEPDIDSLKPDERARYYYYRGMTDYRLNNEKYDVSADARHWLSLAAVSEADFPNSLTNRQISLMCEALGELNRKAYNQAASDAPVVEFKVCKDKAIEAGVEKKEEDDKKDKDEEENPKQKKKKSSE
ncbi:MAG: hypothetical protein RMJ98_20295 [Myxococcales bacterium]|nr:hypothetical protein [Polyangiaceae bacterium]MDW8251642.1 hypothetical protein [Myxococcales bacterium]